MKFSIITAVYNNVNEIGTAINSVLSQTYNDIEYIIIDGGSDDGTIDVISSYGNKIAHFISEPDKGIYHAINKGLSIATGDVIGLLHSDDMFCNPEIIEKIAEIFEICNCDAVYGDLEYVSKTNIFKVIRFWKSAPFDFTKFKKGWMPAHPTLFIKKKVYDQSGRYDTNFKISADYDFILRTLPGGTLKCQYLPMVITRMRSGGTSNKNLKNILRKSYEDWLVLRKNNIGGMMVLIRKNTSKLGQFILKK